MIDVLLSLVRGAVRQPARLLLLSGLVLPAYTASASSQPATLVLGQPDFTSRTVATGPYGMDRPAGVAVDPTSGTVFVVDAGNNRVLRFAARSALSNGAAAEGVLGQPDLSSAEPVSSAQGMNDPTGVAVDSTGRLWVADSGNHRVLRFDGAASKSNGAAADNVLGQPSFDTSVPDAGPRFMQRPTAVALDSVGRLWVADYGNNRVLRFDDAAHRPLGAAADGLLGTHDFFIAPLTTSASGFRQPFSVAVDGAGRLWVSDRGNSRVLRFDAAAGKLDGGAADGVLGQANFTDQIAAPGADRMNGPIGVAVGAAGQLWVVDGCHRVLRFDNAAAAPNGGAADGVLGQPDFSSCSPTTTRDGLNSPVGAAIDSADGVWIGDSSNNRVVLVQPIGTPSFVVLLPLV